MTPVGNTGAVSGGSNQIILQSAQPFQIIYIFVGGVSGNVGGYWQLRLPAPTTSAQAIVTYASEIPNNSFQTVFGVSSPSGSVGTYSSLPTQVLAASSGDVQVSVSWDAASDVDLHVVDPRDEEIYYAHTTSRSGGQLDLDSNAACSIDRKNNENIRWTNAAPGGTYLVRVDYWSSCGVTETNYVVTVKNGAATQTFRGTFTGAGDRGGSGSGRSITSFTHVGPAATSPSMFVSPLFTPSAEKLRQSIP